MPELRSRFLAYGLRATPAKIDQRYGPEPSKGLVARLLDSFGSIQAPHGYFKHFYILSVLSSIFWGYQISSHGFIMKHVAGTVNQDSSSSSMSIDRVALLWSFLMLQGVRRLIETILMTKTSASKMWFAHYLLGMGFYLVMGIAVWIEGAGKLDFIPAPSIRSYCFSHLLANPFSTGTLLSSKSPWQELSFSAPSKRTLLCIPLFIVASGIQHDCHAYLASLPKYTLPTHPIFQVIVCPHYFAECLIYLSMAILGAPNGAWINKTVASALLFVLVNLGATASISKEWYAQKFGKEKVEGRWKMIPFVY